MQVNLVVLTILGSITASTLGMTKEAIDALVVLNMKTAMPSAAILRERLEESGFKELNDTTMLATQLAGQRLSMFDLTERVEAAAQQYYMHKRDYRVKLELEQRQVVLFGAILQDSPDVLSALVRSGAFVNPDESRDARTRWNCCRRK